MIYKFTNIYFILSLRVGARVQKTLGDCDFTTTGCPSSILFPASHGFGLTCTVLIQFLIEHHTVIVKKFVDTKMNPGETKVDLLVVGCGEIVDTSMLVSVDAQVINCLNFWGYLDTGHPINGNDQSADI